MADTEAPAAPAAATPKKAAKAKKVSTGKKPAAKSTHPPTAVMVNAAIKSLKERGGSSLAAIKKYLATTYLVDTQKLAPFIRKYLKKAVADGHLVQVKGSFRLPSKEKAAAPAKAKKPAAKKATKPKTAKPKAAKSPKKAKSPAKKAKVAKKPKSPRKPKAKKPAAKKAPKAKKATPKKSKK